MKYGIKVKIGDCVHGQFLNTFMRNRYNLSYSDFWEIEGSLPRWASPVLTKRLAYSELFQELYG